MSDLLLLVKPSAAQQADLDRLLAAQQDWTSPLYHKWVTPEEFGERFGLSAGDAASIAAWLTSQGLAVNRQARARNWISFSGTAERVSQALHTSIHRFLVNGHSHYANTGAPAVPEALAEVVGGILGLDDFHPEPFAQLVPAYNSGSSHYLAPEDLAAIYDIAPLYKAGFDGTAQGIAVVGQSDVLLSDLRAFRTRYKLPAGDPVMIPYGADPGFNSAQVEGNLDLEWSGAIAPHATVYYVYGADAFTALIFAIDLNVAPIVSVSYGSCEIDASPAYRPIAQQGNAQGMTLLAASGDSGAAGCDNQQSEPLATRGQMVDFPAVLPEVTGVGGTQFVEGTGVYWAPSNDSSFGSALSYIPETAWNQSGTPGLGASGGGVSLLYPKPAWQAGPGVPPDAARNVPDVSLTASGHDAYVIFYNGSNVAVAGTSASAPSMAGVIALLQQYQLQHGDQSLPGLGNINPQLYRLAQTAPGAFHDVVTGNNVVPCSQGSPDCTAGWFGYQASTGYDLATGLGSIDANNLVTQWNTTSEGVMVTLDANPLTASLNDTIQVNAVVAAASGGGMPTGMVDFNVEGLTVGSAQLLTVGGLQRAIVSVPLSQLGAPGTYSLSALYAGDSAFSGGSASLPIRVTLPSGAASIVVTSSGTVWPQQDVDAQGLSWQTSLSLQEVAGVAAMITGFTIDGQGQPVSQYFPSPNIVPNGVLNATVVFRTLNPPVIRTFGFTGIDATGQTWSRQTAVTYLSLPPYDNYSLTATPLTVTESADPSCQWPVQLNLDNTGGYLNLITTLYAGTVDMSSQIVPVFGTTRLDAWGSLQGVLCLNGITPPASDYIYTELSGGVTLQQVQVNFLPAPPNPATITAAPSNISLSTAASGQTAQATLNIGITDKTQPWTISIYPANRTSGWLSVSQLSGAGPGSVTLTASGFGFEPGAYRATLVIQSPNAQPQYVDVPVMFVLGGSTSGTTIAGVTNNASSATTASPGMLLSVYGTNLSNAPLLATGSPLPYSTGGVTATVNGLAAPLLYVSQNQLNIQVPYAAGAGPAVLGVNNNGQVAGFQFRIAPSAPAIYSDGSGNLAGNPTVKPGGVATLYLNGAGEVSPALKTAFFASTTAAPAALPQPVLPLTVTVGGVPALVQFAGLAPGLIGTTQVNFYVPSTATPGSQPVVVTVGGTPSAPLNVTVVAGQ